MYEIPDDRRYDHSQGQDDQTDRGATVSHERVSIDLQHQAGDYELQSDTAMRFSKPYIAIIGRSAYCEKDRHLGGGNS